MTLQWPKVNPPCQDVRPLARLPRLHLAAAIASGFLLATAFPPLEWWPMAFLGLVPYLAVPQPPRLRWRLLGAAALGATHFIASLWWLNSVGFAAGLLLALCCAPFPAAWALLWGTLLWHKKPKHLLPNPQYPSHANTANTADAAGTAGVADMAAGDPALAPGASLRVLSSPRELLQYALLAAAAWTSLEWVRGWLFTGFPWNALGTSQAFAHTRLLATLAGAYGISFLAILANVLLADLVSLRTPRRSLPPLVALALFVALWCVNENRRALPLSPTPLYITAIQGNVPECRMWTPEILQDAWTKYESLTRLAARLSPQTDLFLWPEGALPCEITYPPFAQALRELLRDLPAPLLLGALDERTLPGTPDSLPPPVFNSAFLLSPDSPILTLPTAPRTDYYDKMHLVPFGEYVPMGKSFPWLKDLIGMGRDLTPGQFPALLALHSQNAPGASFQCGLNICFEDAFPGISRTFARKGAQLLATITNDCWYGESAGPRQHLAQAVMRAVENRRPLLRSGNNSHTCLISPKGEILQPILSPSGSPFAQGWRTYQVHPMAKRAPLTLYARTGDLLPKAATLATLLAALSLLLQTLKHKHQLAQALKHTP